MFAICRISLYFRTTNQPTKGIVDSPISLSLSDFFLYISKRNKFAPL